MSKILIMIKSIGNQGRRHGLYPSSKDNVFCKTNILKTLKNLTGLVKNCMCKSKDSHTDLDNYTIFLWTNVYF